MIKQLFSLLDSQTRSVFILIFRYSPNYTYLLNHIDFSENRLIAILEKLEKLDMIFILENHYQIQPNCYKKLFKQPLKYLLKLSFILFGFVLSKYYKKRTKENLTIVDSYLK